MVECNLLKVYAQSDKQMYVNNVCDQYIYDVDAEFM